MRRFALPLTTLFVGLLIGVTVGCYLLESTAYKAATQYRTQDAAKAIRIGHVKIGSLANDPFLGKTRAYHEWEDTAGQEHTTSIHQDKEHVILVETTDGAVTRVSLWEYGHGEAEVHLTQE